MLTSRDIEAQIYELGSLGIGVNEKPKASLALSRSIRLASAASSPRVFKIEGNREQDNRRKLNRSFNRSLGQVTYSTVNDLSFISSPPSLSSSLLRSNRERGRGGEGTGIVTPSSVYRNLNDSFEYIDSGRKVTYSESREQAQFLMVNISIAMNMH